MQGVDLNIYAFLIFVMYITGIVAVKGFWWTLLAIFPPAGIYFGMEVFLKYFGKY